MFTIAGCYTAGGAVLSNITKTPINDYDIYPKNQEGLANAIYYLLEDETGFVVNYTDKALTIKTNEIDPKTNLRTVYQIILGSFYPTAQHIFDHFDFTVCMAAVDGDSFEQVTSKTFWKDVASRTLKFNPGTKFPFNSLLRIKKYQDKGYFLPKAELIKMILTVSNKAIPQTWDEFEAEIGGTYGKTIRFNADTTSLPCTLENMIELLDNVSFEEYSSNFEESDAADQLSQYAVRAWELVLNRTDLIKFYSFDDPSESAMKNVFDYPKSLCQTIKTDTDSQKVMVESPENVFEVIEVPFINNSWLKMDPDTTVYGYRVANENNGEISIMDNNWKRLPVNVNDFVSKYDISLDLHNVDSNDQKRSSHIIFKTSIKDVKSINIDNRLTSSDWKIHEFVRKTS